MEQERESPQEKKRREYGDRVTPGNRRHATVRKKEKKGLMSETRSKGDELLSQIKPQISSADAEVIAGELTGTHLRKSVIRKRPMKSGAVPFSQVIVWQLERRRDSFGRKTKAHPLFDKRAKEAVETLDSSEARQFEDVARRAGRLCSADYRHKWPSELKSEDPVYRALQSLCLIASASNEENQALRRNRDINKTLTAWVKKANRVLAKDRRTAQKKADEQQSHKRKSREIDSK